MAISLTSRQAILPAKNFWKKNPWSFRWRSFLCHFLILKLPTLPQDVLEHAEDNGSGNFL
jgi:hypothetical protein